KTIRLLSTSACAVDGACTQRFKVVLVFGSRLMAGAVRGMPQRTRTSIYYKELSRRCTRYVIQKAICNLILCRCRTKVCSTLTNAVGSDVDSFEADIVHSLGMWPSQRNHPLARPTENYL